MAIILLSFAMFWGMAWGQRCVGLSASLKSSSLCAIYTSKYATTAFIHKDNHICIKKECIHIYNSQTQQENHSAFQNSGISKSVLKTRGGATSSSYGGYSDGYGNDGNNGNNDDDYYNRYDGYENPDRYGPSSASSRGPYYDDYDSKGGHHTDELRSGYYDDEGRFHEEYDDEGRRSPSRRTSGLPKAKVPSSLPTVFTTGNRKLGTIFLASGAAFTALGITLFFNKTLMRLGNLLFVCGVPLMIGPGRTVGYFLQPKKARATGCLACGIFLVLVGHPVIGILLEIFGLLNLFGNMFPLVMMMAKSLPVVGGLFGGDSSNGGSGRRERRRRESNYDDRYYDDDNHYGERGYRRDERY